MVHYLSIIFIIVVLPAAMGFALFKIWPKTGKMGINTKSVNCPRCESKAPVIRKPANMRQVLWGGYTCARCKCEFHKYGPQEIEARKPNARKKDQIGVFPIVRPARKCGWTTCFAAVNDFSGMRVI